MAQRRIPFKLTELERQAYLGFLARYQAIELQATVAREQTTADERVFVAGLAARLGLDPASIGSRFTVNTQTWTLERAEAKSVG